MASARINPGKVKAAYSDLRTRIARGLLAGAVVVVTEHQRRLNVANPMPYLTPSRRGEYPRKRTGNLQANVQYAPTSPAQIADLGYVDVGYTASGFYGEVLTDRGRLGIQDTADDVRDKVQAVIDRVASRA